MLPFLQLPRIYVGYGAVAALNDELSVLGIRRPCSRLMCSRDVSPIEQVFAKLKAMLRKAQARTIENVWRKIGALLPTFKPEECANYFRNPGYASM